MLFNTEKNLSVLAVGAHPDDIELGAGGFIHRLRNELCARVRFLVLTHGLSSRQRSGDYDRGQRYQESIKAAGVLGVDESDVTLLGYQDCGLHRDLHSLIREVEERKELYFHKRLLAGELPQSIGGGIGQSRLCMLYLRKAHVGEIQSGIWPDDMVEQCREHNIPLL